MRGGKLCFFNALLFAHLLFCIITIIIVVNYEAVYSPLFFHKFVRIKCSIYGMGGHLGFICTCTKVAGIRVYSSGGREAKKIEGLS